MKMKQMMIGAAFPMLAALSLPALAVDGKTLPGAACQPVNNAQVFSVSSGGVLFNTSNAPQAVVCPVVRDTIAADPVNGIIAARVYVIDNNNAPGDPRVVCALESRAVNTGVVETFTDQSVAGASPLVQVLDNYVNLSASESGYYYFRCSIPAQLVIAGIPRASGIVMYRVDEDG